ncbi:Oligopeptide transport system permease protein OppC [Rubripirellula obstinata]|uniref:Oligopeptide transport system permease protein OppC n=1 Tax=Rubripirellula obstinata TaxID=406547 RepID=A0A5B1CKC8_9BACT|nr:ABC transporter permease [Rubripirellula obstinata]KAA1260772.1 Oligopeptide transport system permease protein OppC [Rubripirellula obstinata]
MSKLSEKGSLQAEPAEQLQLEQILDESQQIQGVSLWQDAWRRLKRNRVAYRSMHVLIGLALLAILTPLIPLQSPIDKDLNDRQFLPPTMASSSMGSRAGLKFSEGRLTTQLQAVESQIAALEIELGTLSTEEARNQIEQSIKQKRVVGHPFNQLWHNLGPVSWTMCRLRVAVFGDYAIPSICGTDQLGRDVLSRIMWGARVSLTVGIVATLVSLIIGVSYGAIAGYFGGWIDAVMMRIVDTLYSVPFIFVVIFIMTFLGEDSVKKRLEQFGINQLTVFYLIIGAIYWLTMSRVVRGQVLSLKNEQFVEAARTIGASPARIVFRHLVPNVLGVVIVYLTLTIPAVMLFEAFLSFLGLGVSPPDVSWGLLLKDGVDALSSVKLFWWMVVFPGAALALTLFALNFLGDGLRDALDPKMKNKD